MSDNPEFEKEESELPGLVIQGEQFAGNTGEVEAAARRTLAALKGDLDGRHDVMAAALITSARQLDRATASARSKDYGVAQLLAQLRDTFVVLMPEEGGENLDEFDRLARELGRAAAIRDQAGPLS